MLLNVKQRLLLMNVLPGEGNYDTLKIVRDQQALLGFSEEEHKNLKMQRKDGLIVWDEGAEVSVDIRIGEVAATIIKRTLRQLSEEGQLQMEFLPLYEHFVEGEEWLPNKQESNVTIIAEATVEPKADNGDTPTLIRSTKDVMGSRPAAEGAEPTS